MDNPHCCIPSVQATNIASSSSLNTPCGPCFLNIFLPFKWFETNVKGMCQWWLTFFQRSLPFFPLYPLVVHVLRYCKVIILFNLVVFYFCLVSVGGVFSLFGAGWLEIPLHCLQSTLVNIMVVFCFSLWQVGEMCFIPRRSTHFNHLYTFQNCK
jgi:hypothetical protein